MLALEELSRDACRWPLAEFDRGEFLFYGAAIADRLIAPGLACPYCEMHSLIAYKPRATRRVIACTGTHESEQELIAIAAVAA
jgi:hypothetical protein